MTTLLFLRALEKSAARAKVTLPVQVNVDTGMSRLGASSDDALALVKAIAASRYLKVEGFYTHFVSADIDRAFTSKQIQRFGNVLAEAIMRTRDSLCVHAANSAGLIDYPTDLTNTVRPGIILYGLHPAPGFKTKIALKPVLSVHSKIIFLRKILKDQSVSYGRTFIARREMTVATIPIGYNDGYFRALSNRAFMLVGGQRCPVVGRVTMEQTMIDVSKVKSVKVGDPVVVLGQQKKEKITADDLAGWANTINYEIVCALGGRIRDRHFSS